MRDALRDFFGDWFSANGFTVWKLQTAWDYVFFFGIVALGVFFIWLAIKYLERRRTPEHAARRVEKRLLRLGGPGSKVYRNVTVQGKKDSARIAMLWASKDRICIVKVYHFGLDITGSADSAQWRLEFNKDVKTVTNPLPELREKTVVLNRVLQGAGVRGASVSPLAVFADNYGTPRVSLRGVDCAASYQNLKKWLAAAPKGPEFDLSAAEKALENAFV